MAYHKPELDSGYYLQHFNELLQFVAAHYQAVLTADSQAFISDFAALAPSAQLLLVRMLNRKGAVFCDSELSYDEIGSPLPWLTLLQQQGFVAELQTADLTDFWLRLTKQTLWQLIELAQQQLAAPLELKKSATKPQLLRVALSLPVDWLALIHQLPQRYVVLQRQAALSYIYFLYFGRIESNLSLFTLRDLGIRQTGQFKQVFQPRFTELAQAQLAFSIASAKAPIQALAKKLKPLTDVATIRAELQPMLTMVEHWLQTDDPQLSTQRSERCYQLGRIAEQQRQIDFAIAFYQQSADFPASERLARLYWQQGEREQCQSYLQQLLNDPACDEEWLFADDFFTRHFPAPGTVSAKRSRLTDLLQQAPSIGVDELYLGKAEQGVIAHYQRQGYQAFHAENNLWLALFALWFWHELFEHPASALHNPFERRPRNLSAGLFYPQFADSIEQKLQWLDEPGATQHLLNALAAHFGKRNSICFWPQDLAEQLLPLVKQAPAKALATLLRHMAQDFQRCSSGYPDLLLIKGNELAFVEVKAPGDKIQRHQLARLLALQQVGFNARLEKLHWIIDPDRIYVVLDVETTGGKAGSDRVIEIGAVKVQSGEIIDSFSTLLDPQRRIPSFISRLTGITNNMVVGAPTFAEIADSLAAFLNGAVFVAHNVKFDYGFIKAEFARLAIPLDMPQLCTVVNMRRFYPGHVSYSLGKLCQALDIPLLNHHRALDDAKAAAQLLLLINHKRGKPEHAIP
ncbi:MAG: exonuclease domain-containing protein [Alishewanella sp.]|nr:exonuclease domain-containing protein [Alishewanella sp.]